MTASKGPETAQNPHHLTLDGVTIAPGVVEMVTAIATEEVEGVAAVCGRTSLRRRSTVPAVDVELVDDTLTCSVHVVAVYGYVLHELGKEVQQAISHALEAQMGIRPSRVDVFIDDVAFDG